MSLQTFDGPPLIGVQTHDIQQEGLGSQAKRKRAHRDPSGIQKDGKDKYATEVDCLLYRSQ